ncbi:CZB domain-containing protein [Geomonas edaphica]|uniref:CZB domain-containing protein n=1 Tax=Geomonas edaphica TaxID=2570226 RepID=UPI0010A8112B|nr:CZB domain-containing protein [Geomonas edaphica]
MDKQEINNAISEHALYKYRLNEVIAKGELESPKGPCTEHDCAFGKWFYGSDIPPRHRSSAYYHRVKELHAEFHKVACNVAHMAVDGDREGAQRMMELEGEFSLISNQMMEALIKWRDNI